MATLVTFKSGANHEMSPGQVITPGEGANFDTATERWYFGSGTVPAAYRERAISKPAGQSGSWVCFGLSDVERLPGPNSPIIATVTWRGLINANNNTKVTETRGVIETSHAALTGIPSSGGTVKARTFDIVPGYSIRKIHIGTNPPGRPAESAPGGKMLKPAEITGADPTQINITALSTDVVWNFPWGWIPFNYQVEEALPGIWFSTVEYRFIFQKQLG